ncbi:hypothetical protein GDO78_011431 [Eleutherodactylus coqui]|uniref:Uncharacterized protein n=1 Tax=Eleutherodactylus coqui TaxID=57060 RepID=A0A8J6F812_ELECQ|nr:hypothetical protein GDO78_011431 [Eleutherodactylus coqui]
MALLAGTCGFTTAELRFIYKCCYMMHPVLVPEHNAAVWRCDGPRWGWRSIHQAQLLRGPVRRRAGVHRLYIEECDCRSTC